MLTNSWLNNNTPQGQRVSAITADHQANWYDADRLIKNRAALAVGLTTIANTPRKPLNRYDSIMRISHAQNTFARNGDVFGIGSRAAATVCRRPVSDLRTFGLSAWISGQGA